MRSMIFPKRWKSIAAILATAVAVTVTLSPGAAHADLAFRKKPADKGASAAHPSGGELGGTEADAAASKAPPKLQAQDPDDPSAAEAKAKAAQAALVAKAPPPPPPPEPVYKHWKFWAVTGAVVVGAIALVWGGSALIHAANGGDPKSCNSADIGCFGEGR
jgi:hypothetical protein